MQSLSVEQAPCALQVPWAQYISSAVPDRVVAVVVLPLQSSSLVQEILVSPEGTGNGSEGTGNGSEGMGSEPSHTLAQLPFSQVFVPTQLISKNEFSRLKQSASEAQVPDALQKLKALQYSSSPGQSSEAPQGQSASEEVQFTPHMLFVHVLSPMQRAMGYPWFSSKKQSLTAEQPPILWQLPSEAQ